MLCHESDFIVFIGWLRKELGLNRSELAAEVGVPVSSLQRWENGNYKPSPTAMVALGKYCARMVKDGKLTVPKPEPWNRNVGSTPIGKPGFDSSRPKPSRETPRDAIERRRERIREYREFLGLR